MSDIDGLWCCARDTKEDIQKAYDQNNGVLVYLRGRDTGSFEREAEAFIEAVEMHLKVALVCIDQAIAHYGKKTTEGDVG